MGKITKSVNEDEKQVSNEVLEFIEENGYEGVDDEQFSHTLPLYNYIGEQHNFSGDEVFEFLIEKLNAALNK